MVSKDRKGLFELVLFDVTVSGEVSTGGTSRDEVFSGEEGQCAVEVVVGEMDLS